MKRLHLVLLTSLIGICLPSYAKQNIPNGSATPPVVTNNGLGGRTASGDCLPASAQTDLSINNVRTTILTGGDMWWDLGDARYEIPKGGKRHSLYAGALWIGGYDAATGGNLKVAAMTYRQTGNDFWPGPLNVNTGDIEKDRCVKFDRHFQITKVEVDEFIDALASDPGSASSKITPNIATWPGNGDPSFGESQYLAPFYDFNGDGKYNPSAGDYPKFYDPKVYPGGCKGKPFIYGDKALWWVFNDKGNIHTESNSTQAIGLEIRAQAFGFATNDEINDMTFYQYEIINRSTNSIYRTYFGQWVDPDLGNFNDDYVGCDVKRGLGFVYNGDENDEGTAGYGTNPPALGVDFFQGPLADAADGIDNDKDGTIDEVGEEIIMSKFMYYNNDYTDKGNPQTTNHFYQYLDGVWKDGTKVKFGGDGKTSAISGDCDFMFPWDTDPLFPGEDWSEDHTLSSPPTNVPADRRFLQSAGKFTLQPGAVNYITTGVVWGRAFAGGRISSVGVIKQADDKAQLLFDNCFKVLDGPSAPDLTLQELDREILIYMTNDKPTSNNYKERYNEQDVTIITPTSSPRPNFTYDPNFRFQGYKLYQVSEPTATATDLSNPSKARLVAQCDYSDGVGQIINYTFDIGVNGIVPKEMVAGTDNGVEHSFRITEDLFAQGNARLVNNKSYYFIAVAYAYNNYKQYKQDQNPVLVDSTLVKGNWNGTADTIVKFISNSAAYDGQKKPYLEGRLNVKVYTGVPHVVAPEKGGTVAKASFGDGVEVTRLEGRGNGGNELELTEESVNNIVANGFATNLTYKAGKGPLNIKVIDPLNIPVADFELKFTKGAKGNAEQPDWMSNYTIPSGAGKYTYKNILLTDSCEWELKITRSGKVDTMVYSDRSIKIKNEQILPDYGISITIGQTLEPGPNGKTGIKDVEYEFAKDNGFLSASIEFTDPAKQWLTGIPDGEGGFMPNNWIRSGADNKNSPGFTDKKGFDDDQNYEKILGGTWAPYSLVGFENYNVANPSYVNMPSFNETAPSFNTNKIETWPAVGARLSNVSSVLIVLTADKTKWTRSPVFEMHDIASEVGGTRKFNLRNAPSVDKNGSNSNTGDATNPEKSDYVSATGMGWFPGYAINVETGERLNIGFGEDSYFASDNGADMQWNPTSVYYNAAGKSVWGGKHYVYVYGANAVDNVPAYDKGAYIMSLLSGLDNNANVANAQKRIKAFKDAMWVTLPILAQKQTLLATDVKIRLNVGKPYGKYFTLRQDSLTSPSNNNFPMYKFSTAKIATVTGNEDAAKAALDLINVVPNPYYAYSAYEINQLDNRVKITNLPNKCDVTIYTVNGNLIRKFVKDDPKTTVDWDLKNTAGIPIASGLYVIHIKSAIGEKTVKWMGMLRPIDLDNF